MRKNLEELELKLITFKEILVDCNFLPKYDLKYFQWEIKKVRQQIKRLKTTRS
jgi:hypothetical protein